MANDLKIIELEASLAKKVNQEEIRELVIIKLCQEELLKRCM